MTATGRAFWDGLGQLLSALCMVHCMVLSLVLGFLPAATAEVVGGKAVHQGFVVFAALTAALAFLPAWRHHRRVEVPGLAVTGLLLLLIAVFLLPEGAGEALEMGLNLGGGVLLAVAHMRNRTLCRACCALKPGVA
jgi:MerC mercury resistance protein